MADQSAPDPFSLFRIGRSLNPLEFPPLTAIGRGRFDDPLCRLAVLYATSDRKAAFMETLDQFRLSISALAEVQSRTGESVDPRIRPSLGSIGRQYFHRRIVRFRPVGTYRWLDVRSPAVHVTVLREMAVEFSRLDVGPRITLGHLLGGDYRIPQTFTRWAIDNGYHGIVYASCHSLESECWAIFEGVELEEDEPPSPISKRDPDLLEVAKLWNLTGPD